MYYYVITYKYTPNVSICKNLEKHHILYTLLYS